MLGLFREKEKIINKVIYLITLIISVLVLISIISIGLFTWPKADDFSLLLRINKLGIFQRMITNYNNWDGRAISLGIVQTFFFKYLPVEIINFIWATCLVLTALVSLKIFIYLSRPSLKFKASEYLIGTAIFSSILWYGFKSHLAETVYWATGGVYIMALLFAVIWLYLWLTKFSLKTKINNLKKILFYLFTIYVGALTQNLSCAVLTYIGIEMVKAKLKKDKIMVRKTASILILLFTGLLITTLAPGNFVRSTYGESSFVINFLVLGFNYITTLVVFIRASLPLFFLIIIGLPIFVIFVLYSYNIKLKKELIIKIKLNKILSLFQFLLAAMASILPFVFLPDFVAPRTSIYFMSFIFFWVFFEIVPLILKNTTKTIKNETIYKQNRYFLFVTVFLFYIFSIAIIHIVNLSRIKNEVLKREEIIKTYSNKNIDVAIYPIDKTKLPFSYTFPDITEDKNNWINRAVADTYKVKSIRIDYNLYRKQ